MTESQKFIISHIDKLIQNFPSIQLKYEFITFDNSHFIEVTPSFVFKQNEDYIAAENYLRLAFIENFPYQTIGFGTEDSLYKLENIFYEKKGNLYDMNQIAYESNFADDMTSMFENTQVLFPKTLQYSQETNRININQNHIYSQKIQIVEGIDNLMQATGEISFALAA